jgi:hypothetical protein
MAGYRITPVLIFWTGRALHWVEFTFETGFELSSSWNVLPCYVWVKSESKYFRFYEVASN